jgi:hypothetical protein
MPIDHTCNCGKKFRLKDEFAGKKFRCPACSAVNQAAVAAPKDWLSEQLAGELPADRPNPLLPAGPVPTAPRSATLRRLRKDWPFDLQGTIYVVIAAALIIATPIVAYFAYRTYRKGADSADWPSCDCTITHSSVERKMRKARNYYLPKIEYRYKVNGQEYHGDRISFVAEVDESQSGVQAIADRYPVDSTRKVFYDPADPSSCTLETGTAASGTLLMVFVTVALAVAGVYFLRDALKTGRK